MSLRNLENFKEIEIIYGIKNIVTNKWYIGSTCNLHDRMRRHKYYLLNNQHHSSKLQRSFNKYGIDNFDVLILKNCDKLDIDQLINKEIDTIIEYNSVENGYNMTKDCRIYKQFKLSKESINKAVNKRYKPVVCLTKTGKFIKEYKSVSQAAIDLQEQTTNISKACKLGCSHYVKGFLFLYKKDFDPTKQYKYLKYLPCGEHLEKIKKKAKNNYKTRKIYELNDKDFIINVFNSVSELEKASILKKILLENFIKIQNLKQFFISKIENLKLKKVNLYKDIVYKVRLSLSSSCC